MNKNVLNVRRVGFLNRMKGDTRPPESFALPACMTSLMEAIGEDVRWRTFEAHGRSWTDRFINKEFLAASGMGFGLLWHPDVCTSSFDLTQVHADHNDAIRHAFDYAGYGCEIIERTDDNAPEMRARMVKSIDAGVPVLAFGVVGPPECALVCGYESDGAALIGWSHFQSSDPNDLTDVGMFIKRDWHDAVWKLVLCGAKGTRADALEPILRRGVAIMQAETLSGYLSGDRAYDAWMAYVQEPAYAAMESGALKAKHRFHHMLVGNHAEARCYLGDFLADRAGDDADLDEAARAMHAIHDECWQVWRVLGGINAPDAYKGLRDAAKRAELGAVIGRIKALDAQALRALRRWMADRV